MFNIRLDQATYGCNSLENQANRLKNLQYDLDSVKRNLYGLSGMDGVMNNIDRQSSRLGEEYRSLSQMLSVLNKILLDYSRCENRICDNSEESIITYRHMGIGNTDLTGISNILSGL